LQLRGCDFSPVIRWPEFLRAGFLGFLIAAGWGCRPGPVARVRLEPERLSLGYGESALLRFHWQPAKPLDRLHGNPKVFVHLLERPGKVLRTFDHALAETWSPGRPQSYEIDLYQSVLGPALPGGTYLLSFGLYDDSWGYRWPLDTGSPDVGRREYRGATVVVPGGGGAGTRFELSGGWGPLEPGTDQQILARRWLKGPGAIRVTDIQGRGSVRLLLNVLERGPKDIEVSNGCQPGKAERLGPGHRWFSFEGRSGACEIRLEPAPSSDPVSGGPERSLWLESLAWRKDLR
jgi:hypothetical protein